ncbi:trypsin inhibitor DE5 alpha chain-like [Neltuma alba]|uniref:trypsin inhibitor DE5 alpha chain-like n=1 Tax=Neltuma alba TaxID=207710 RepID=UPI0010A2CFA9|nr:trypsin inhibitor DE5 alpha chain-like [Prosopis alba]XP_028798439.1 trypsin inhibitor DE5 alpha chain-like [Prosopis alba]
MQITNALAAFFFFFFFFFFGFTGAEFIYDTDGDILKNGGHYRIQPLPGAIEAIVGASISSNENSSSCSIAVVVALQDISWPTKISTPFPLNYITNDYPLNISFTNLPSNASCTNTPDWVVATQPAFNDTDPIMVGKFEEFSLPRSGYFYIKPYESTKYYVLAFCYSKDSCGYVTYRTDSDGKNRMVVSMDRSETPFAYMFFKAIRDNNVASGISMAVGESTSAI